MAIITEKGSFVKWAEKKKQNIKIANKFFALAIEADKRAEKYQACDDFQKADAERTHGSEYRKRGYRMKDCSRFITTSVCPECQRTITSSATLCRDRVCPTCAWRLSAKQSAEMLQTLALVNDIEETTACFLTLTLKNCSTDQLRPTLDMMSESWHRMAMKKKFKDIVLGTARSVEITYNKVRKEFHPHLHTILLLDTEKIQNETIEELGAFFNQEWKKANRLLYEPITDLRLIHNFEMLETDKANAEFYKKAILETFKYTIKDDTMQDMTLADFRFYVDGVQGKRLVSYSGIIKTARQALEMQDELEQEETTKCCPDCSSEMLSAVYAWSFASGTYKRFATSVLIDGRARAISTNGEII